MASIVATTLQYVLLIFFVEVLSFAAIAAGTLAFAVGAVTNYMLRRNFVFRRDTPHRQGVPRFVVVASMALAMNAAILWVALDGLGLPYLWAQVSATGMLFAWNFLAHRHWTFAPARRRAKALRFERMG